VFGGKEGRRVWREGGLEGLRIGGLGGLRRLTKQPKTFFFPKSRKAHPSLNKTHL